VIFDSRTILNLFAIFYLHLSILEVANLLLKFRFDSL